jgi:hypothetical protein
MAFASLKKTYRRNSMKKWNLCPTPVAVFLTLLLSLSTTDAQAQFWNNRSGVSALSYWYGVNNTFYPQGVFTVADTANWVEPNYSGRIWAFWGDEKDTADIMALGLPKFQKKYWVMDSFFCKTVSSCQLSSEYIYPGPNTEYEANTSAAQKQLDTEIAAWMKNPSTPTPGLNMMGGYPTIMLGAKQSSYLSTGTYGVGSDLKVYYIGGSAPNTLAERTNQSSGLIAFTGVNYSETEYYTLYVNYSGDTKQSLFKAISFAIDHPDEVGAVVHYTPNWSYSSVGPDGKKYLVSSGIMSNLYLKPRKK